MNKKIGRPEGIPAHNKIDTPINDLLYLEDLYLNQNLTIKQIAVMFNLKLSLVKARVSLLSRKNHNRGRFKSKPLLEFDILYQKYVIELQSVAQIAKTLNVSGFLIRKNLLHFNIPLRTKKEQTALNPPLKGKKASFETRKKQSLAKLKISESEWIGFTEPNNRKRNKTPEWNAWRKMVFIRDGFKCCECGSQKRLQAHHIIMRAIAPELSFDVNNGITLCFTCHKNVRFKEQSLESKYQMLVHNINNARCSELYSFKPINLLDSILDKNI